MDYSFPQLEELVARLPIDPGNFALFEELLRQPYDVYRPVMDMLFDGTIVVEDLMRPEGTPSGSAAAARPRDPGPTWGGSTEALARRCRELIAGRPSSAALVAVDMTSAFAGADGRPSALYVPVPDSVVGGDSLTANPNPIELARAGSAEEAQKAAQAAFGAATQPQIE